MEEHWAGTGRALGGHWATSTGRRALDEHWTSTGQILDEHWAGTGRAPDKHWTKNEHHWQRVEKATPSACRLFLLILPLIVYSAFIHAENSQGGQSGITGSIVEGSAKEITEQEKTDLEGLAEESLEDFNRELE